MNSLDVRKSSRIHGNCKIALKYGAKRDLQSSEKAVYVLKSVNINIFFLFWQRLDSTDFSYRRFEVVKLLISCGVRCKVNKQTE